jgi:sulfur carrier protein
MKLIVNGEPVETSAGVVAELVKEQAGASARVAVVVNGQVVPAAGHADARLGEGDRVELLIFAGGG